MQNPPGLDAAALARLAEATAFERLTLELAVLFAGRVSGNLDLRSHPSSTTVFVGGAEMGTARLEAFKLQLRPLMFGAAWKVLDLMIEHALPDRRRWSIAAKATHA